jgi:hypothetical protein
MIAITVREAWLIRFSAESGSVTFRKRRQSAAVDASCVVFAGGGP